MIWICKLSQLLWGCWRGQWKMTCAEKLKRDPLRSQLQQKSDTSCVWCLYRRSCICETLLQLYRWAFPCLRLRFAPGLLSKAISQIRLDKTFPCLLHFTGVCRDNRVPHSLCKELFVPEAGLWRTMSSAKLRPLQSCLIKIKVKFLQIELCLISSMINNSE